MSGYDNPRKVVYDLGLIDFGASNVTRTIPVPGGRAGKVVAVHIAAVAEDFAGSTSDAGVRVGDGSDDDKYYDTGLVLDESVDIADGAVLTLADDGAKVDIEPDRSTITVTCVAAVGTPTGQAEVHIEVDWF
jgi:hypothetical protein